MFNDNDVFERERRAYELIGRSIREMLASGFEIRTFDNILEGKLEMLFVGPPQGNERPEIRKLALPYEFLSLLADGDKADQAQLNWHANQVKEASRRLQSFLHEMIIRKFDGGKGDNRGH
jgi:hypothetical protein